MILCLGLLNIDVTFAVDKSLSRHTDNRKIDIPILGEGLTETLDDIAIRAEAIYSLRLISQTKKKNYLGLHHSANNNFFYVNGVINVYQFKPKDSDREPYQLCLRNISNDLTVDNIKKPRLNG